MSKRYAVYACAITGEYNENPTKVATFSDSDLADTFAEELAGDNWQVWVEEA